MNDGWIKIHRKILNWEWYQDTNVFRVFIHLLLMANHTDCKWQGKMVKRGQLITSYPHISTQLSNRYQKFSIQSVRTALHKLKLTGEITVNTTNEFSVITINNYNSYQEVNRQTDKQSTDNQQAINRLATTNKNDKNDKNEKNKRETHSFKEEWKSEYGEKYIQAFNKLFNSHSILTPKRVEKLKLRFRTFKKEEIAQALINLSESKFHQGDNPSGWKADPDFLIRSDEMVDKWLNAKGGDST